MIKATSETFRTEVLDERGTMVLVDFSAAWCPPCKVLKPILEEYAKETEGKLKIVYVDIDDSSDLMDTYNILAVPTLILFKNGNSHARTFGNQSKSDLKKFTGI